MHDQMGTPLQTYPGPVPVGPQPTALEALRRDLATLSDSLNACHSRLDRIEQELQLAPTNFQVGARLR
jgi:hypothetical protein